MSERFTDNMRIEELRTTADKKLRYASPKLPSATSFIRKTLGEIDILEE